MPDGERRFRPSGNAARYLSVCDTERIELRAGDLIRWTRNRKAPPGRGRHPRAPDLVNGGEAEIVEIGYRRVRFREGGREFGLSLTDPQLRHLDHAYCSTVHSAQGRTARAAIAVLDVGAGADRELFHVELSRVSEEFLLLTDDREALIESLQAYDRSEDGALEALGIDLSEPPVVDPEVFAALAADWRALLREGEETNTVPFLLPGYRDTMAQAAALAQVEDLPEDMRRLTGTMLAKHEEHLAHDREVQGLVEGIRDHWRRWPELGWAVSLQGVPVETLPEHAAWREEGAALLEAAARLGVEGEASHGEVAHHLHAMPGGSAGLEDAVGMLERTRLLDDAGRFERVWRTLRERAAETGVPELHAQGYRQVAELGQELAAAEGLDAQAQRAVAEWREVDTAQAALAEEVRALPGRIAAWQAAVLPQDEPGGLDPDHPTRQSWREEGAALQAAAGDMLRPEDVHAPHLHAVPGGREAVRQAAEEVADALRHDRLPGIRVADEGGKPAGARDRDRGVPCAALRRAGGTGGGALRAGGAAGAHAGGCRLMARLPCPVRTGLPADPGMAHARLDALTADCPERPATLDALDRLAAAGGAPARRGPCDAGERRPPRAPSGRHAGRAQGAG